MGQPVVHFEIGCRDSGKTTDFYAKLFDWRIEQAGARCAIRVAPFRTACYGLPRVSGRTPSADRAKPT